MLLVLGALPGAVGYGLYPRLLSRGVAWLIAFGALALLAVFLAGTSSFWWLADRAGAGFATSQILVAAGIGTLAGVLLMSTFVGVFGGADPITPRPLHRVVATAITAVASILLCQALISFQSGLS